MSQASASSSDTSQIGLISREKFFYFIVEKEFEVKKQLLIHNGYLQAPDSHSTINLIRLSNKSEPRVFKIDGRFSSGELNQNENISYYRQAITFAKFNFMRSESEFIGCVRDSDSTRQHLNEELLGCDVRSDNFHDIINNVINVFKSQTLLYQDQPLKYQPLKYEVIEKKYNLDKLENFAVKDKFTENCARAMDEWFRVKLNAMNEIISSAPGSSKCKETRQAKLIVHFLKLLEAVWNFMDRNFDEIHEKYARVKRQLEKFSWEEENIICLDWLKQTMALNLKLYREENISFKPKYLSTQFIEAEKGWLRFEANNSSPTPQRCIDWTNQAISGCNLMQDTLVLRSFSGFGKVDIKFSKLPEYLERKHYSHTTTIQSMSSLRSEISTLSDEQNEILSGSTTYLKQGQPNIGDHEMKEAYKCCMAVFEHGHTLSLGNDDFSSCIKNIASSSNTSQIGLISEEKFFYFIVENEFEVKKQLLIHNGYLQAPNSHSTINLIRLSNKSEPRVFKIDGRFSSGKLKQNENTSYYRQAIAYVKFHFMKSESEFLGCVRDNDPTRQHLNKELLGCDVRSDSFHDIANNVKHLFKYQTLLYRGQPLKYEVIEKKYNLDKLENFAVKDKFTENCARALDEWFRVKLTAMNEIISSAPGSSNCEETRQARLVVHFLKLLEAVWNFMDRNFDEIDEEYEDAMKQLAKYSWKNKTKKIICLDSLKQTMALNLKLHREENISFKPKYLSTQFIEAEKGWLRFEAKNSNPTPQRCIDWTNKAISGCNLMQDKLMLTSFSGFGKVNIKFSKLPEHLERKHYSHTTTIQSMSSLRSEISTLYNEHNGILSGLTTFLKQGQPNIGDPEMKEAYKCCMAVCEKGYILSLGDDHFSSCIKNIASRFPFYKK